MSESSSNTGHHSDSAFNDESTSGSTKRKRSKTSNVNSPVSQSKKVSQSNSPITKSLDKLGKAYKELVPKVLDARDSFESKKNSKPLKRVRMILDLTMDSLRSVS